MLTVLDPLAVRWSYTKLFIQEKEIFIKALVDKEPSALHNCTLATKKFLGDSKLILWDFADVDLWSKYSHATLAQVIYHGDLKEVFSQVDAIAKNALTMPDKLALALFLDATPYDLVEQIKLLNFQYFENFLLIIKGLKIPFGAISVGNNRGYFGYISDKILPQKKIAKRGLLLAETSRVKDMVAHYGIDNIRLLYREHAHLQWEGLDEIIVDARVLDLTTERLIKGFSAAGGNIDYFS